MFEHQPDIAAIRRSARREWERTQVKRRPLSERIARTVPLWLLVVAMALFMQSAPHTALAFEAITPVFGKVAPFGVEFGMVYIAFIRFQRQRLNWNERVLEVLLFGMSLLVNGYGAISSVAQTTTELAGRSFPQIIASYGSLPIDTQAKLILAFGFAIFVPLGTFVAGSGLAELALKTRETLETLDADWEAVQAVQVAYALRDEVLRLNPGVDPRLARDWSASVSGGIRSARPLSTPSTRPPETPIDGKPAPSMDGSTSGETDLKTAFETWKATRVDLFPADGKRASLTVASQEFLKDTGRTIGRSTVGKYLS